MLLASTSGTIKVHSHKAAWAAAIAAITLLPAFAARAATVVTFQNGDVNNYAGTQDTQLFGYSTSVDENSGTYPALAIGDSNVAHPRPSIIRFDGLGALAGLYSSIDSAKLVLTQYDSSSGGGTSSVSVYQISDANAGWFEGDTYLGPAGPGEHGATWNHKDYSNDVGYTNTNWAGSAGLSTPTTDYNPVAEDSTAVSWANDAGGTTHEWDLSPALIDQWITGANAGLLLKIDDPAYSWAFHSSESSSVASRPMLQITYTAVPEPASGLLLLAGVCAFASMRRRKTRN